jgi:hypothetical protein
VTSCLASLEDFWSQEQRLKPKNIISKNDNLFIIKIFFVLGKLISLNSLPIFWSIKKALSIERALNL